MESLRQDYENGQHYMEEESRKEEEDRLASAPVITLDEIMQVRRVRIDQQVWNKDEEEG